MPGDRVSLAQFPCARAFGATDLTVPVVLPCVDRLGNLADPTATPPYCAPQPLRPTLQDSLKRLGAGCHRRTTSVGAADLVRARTIRPDRGRGLGHVVSAHRGRDHAHLGMRPPKVERRKPMTRISNTSSSSSRSDDPRSCRRTGSSAQKTGPWQSVSLRVDREHGFTPRTLDSELRRSGRVLPTSTVGRPAPI